MSSGFDFADVRLRSNESYLSSKRPAGQPKTSKIEPKLSSPKTSKNEQKRAKTSKIEQKRAKSSKIEPKIEPKTSSKRFPLQPSRQPQCLGVNHNLCLRQSTHKLSALAKRHFCISQVGCWPTCAQRGKQDHRLVIHTHVGQSMSKLQSWSSKVENGRAQASI